MLISGQKSISLLLFLVGAVIVFHFAILGRLIPYDIVWAGKIKSEADLIRFESISIGINFLLIVVLALKGNYWPNSVPAGWLNAILWVFLVLFLLNTVGNVLAETWFEKIVFTPMTLLFSFLIWNILKNPEKGNFGKTNS